MTGIGRPILTAAQMRAAEAEAIAGGVSGEVLMERAGRAAAEAILRFAGPRESLVLCGPGNNGGDGYVVARILAERGASVRVAALAEPASPAAFAARSRWGGVPVPLAEAGPAPLLVDALFGTGLDRPLGREVADHLARLAAAARIRAAIDLPSGVGSDDGALLSPVPAFHLTVTFQTLKPAHRLQPAARLMGRVAVADIGVPAGADLFEVARPRLKSPGPDDHKYSRGYVALLGGEMPGAIALAAAGAARAGAGYVRIIGDERVAGAPAAVVQGGGDPPVLLDDARIDALAVGPGLGSGPCGRARLAAALASPHKLVLDADALNLLAGEGLDRLRRPGLPTAILTPHQGEFTRLFGDNSGDSKIVRARRAAAESGAVVLLKGSDTVVAAPDGRAAIAPPAPAWLASAGTGDVLTGIVAAMRARGLDAFAAACAATWLHGRAAERAGAAFIADDLPDQLPDLLERCR